MGISSRDLVYSMVPMVKNIVHLNKNGTSCFKTYNKIFLQ